MEDAMNAVDSEVGGPELGESQSDDFKVQCACRSGCECTKGRESSDVLTSLGRLLRGHTWHDSQDWARALDQLSRLSEDDLKRVIDASREPSPT
jgi:hypothetical protein